MTPNAAIIASLLIAEGYASDPEADVVGDWPVYISFLPAEGDNAIVTYDTAGMLDGRIMGTGEQVEHPGVQVRVRGLDYAATFRKVQEIAEALDTAGGSVVVLEVSYRIQNISRTGSIMPMGIESEDRPRFHFSINMILTLR